MACPVGLSADAASLAVRAGVVRKAELPYCDDAGRPIVGSHLAQLDKHHPDGRWFHLLAYALEDLAGTTRYRLQDAKWLCVIPSRAREASATSADLAKRLGAWLGFERPLTGLEILSGDARSGVRALARARELISQGEAPAVLVCASDSLVSPRRLLELSRASRLLTEDNSDGVIPGEAAACLLLTPHSAEALGAIRGIGFGREPALLDNDVPLRADGLVAAARSALREASLALHDMEVRVSDAAGEGYAFREQALTVARLLRVNMASFPLDLPALALGDTGCAASLCGVVLSLPRVVPAGVRIPRHVIAYSGGASGERGAVVLERLERPRNG